MGILKTGIATTVLVCLAIFIRQNREILELHFLAWTFQTRRAYMLLVVFGAGITLGWLVGTISQLRVRGSGSGHGGSRGN